MIYQTENRQNLSSKSIHIPWASFKGNVEEIC